MALVTIALDMCGAVVDFTAHVCFAAEWEATTQQPAKGYKDPLSRYSQEIISNTHHFTDHL